MKTYAEVNEGLKAVKDYLTSIEEVWNKTRNLKLYNVSFQAAAIIEKYPLVKEEYSEYDLFSWFCENEYDNFTEWMKESNIEDCRNYIGRTSSFYLTDMHCDKIGYVIDTFLTNIYGGYYQVDIDEAGNMIPFTDTDNYTEADQIEDYQETMEYIASGEFLEDIKKELSDAVKIADYIDSFKKDQIELFTEYIECKNSDLEYEAEQEQKAEQAFIDTYGEVISNMTAVIENFISLTNCTITDAHKIITKAMEQVKVDDKALKTA